MSNGSNSHKFFLTARVVRHIPPIPPEDIEVPTATHDKVMACDSMIVIPCMTNNGSIHALSVESFDGKTGEAMAEGQIFSAWLVLAGMLSRQERLSPMYREFAKFTFDAMSKQVFGIEPPRDTKGMM